MVHDMSKNMASFSVNTIKIFVSCNENINVNKKKVDPDLIFFTAQRSENISFIFSLVKI